LSILSHLGYWRGRRRSR